MIKGHAYELRLDVVTQTTTGLGPMFVAAATFSKDPLTIARNLGNRHTHHGVAVYLVPSAYGGHLELSRKILVDTMNALTASGQGISNASSWADTVKAWWVAQGQTHTPPTSQPQPRLVG